MDHIRERNVSTVPAPGLVLIIADQMGPEKLKFAGLVGRLVFMAGVDERLEKNMTSWSL